MRCLLEGKRLLEGGAYFNVDTQMCSAYLRAGAYKRKYGISNMETIFMNTENSKTSEPKKFIYYEFTDKLK